MIASIDELIAALGGASAAAKLAGVKSPAVSNWRSRGRMPAELYLLFNDVLKANGQEADPRLFGMSRPTAEARP